MSASSFHRRGPNLQALYKNYKRVVKDDKVVLPVFILQASHA